MFFFPPPLPRMHQTRQMYEEYGSEYIKDHPFVSAAI